MRPAYEVLDALREAFDRHDVEAITALHAPDATIRRTDGTTTDPAAMAATYKQWFADETDVRIDLRAAFGDDRIAMAEFALAGALGHRPLTIVVETVAGLITDERYYAPNPPPG